MASRRYFRLRLASGLLVLLHDHVRSIPREARVSKMHQLAVFVIACNNSRQGDVNHAAVVKMVLGSAVNADGDHLYPRRGTPEFVGLPIGKSSTGQPLPKRNPPAIRTGRGSGLSYRRGFHRLPGFSNFFLHATRYMYMGVGPGYPLDNWRDYGRSDMEKVCPVLCPPPNHSERDGVSLVRWKALEDKASVAIRRNWSHSV